jgi:type IV fimbrial biogenesis protein FimT
MHTAHRPAGACNTCIDTLDIQGGNMRSRAPGFTLIELLIAMVIAAILLTIGLPSFTDLLARNRLTTQANDLISALNTARSEAVRQGAPVCVKRVSATANNWSDGWRVFVDSSTARTISAAADFCKTESTLLQVHDALAGGNTLTSSDFPLAVRYNALGVAVNASDVGISGNFNLCRQGGANDQSRQISINVSGSVSVKNHTCT